ncbi:MAG: hypothetical protein ACXVCY_15555 [Pseudobdellovibrionaceae bacterium]
MVLVLESSYLERIGQERLGHLYNNLTKHKSLGWVCFFVGGLWAAQNIWYSSL